MVNLIIMFFHAYMVYAYACDLRFDAIDGQQPTQPQLESYRNMPFVFVPTLDC
jgi:hypothetical protein